MKWVAHERDTLIKTSNEFFILGDENNYLSERKNKGEEYIFLCV